MREPLFADNRIANKVKLHIIGQKTTSKTKVDMRTFSSHCPKQHTQTEKLFATIATAPEWMHQLPKSFPILPGTQIVLVMERK